MQSSDGQATVVLARQGGGNTVLATKGVRTFARFSDASPADADAVPTQIDNRASAAPQDAANGWLTCPYCWHQFEPEDILFISSHAGLVGDATLGTEEQLRFLPTRLTPQGAAYDAENCLCTEMACPVCHLRIPKGLLSHTPFFVSTVGTEFSGKSYFLAAMCHALRSSLLQKLGLAFTDCDPRMNTWINEYESRLFFNRDSTEPATLDKTQKEGGPVYQYVELKNMRVMLPRPSMFSLTPLEAETFLLPRMITFYDNAGEHFAPDNTESASLPVTRHLVQAAGIFFLFDPTRDPRFRSVLDSEDMQLRKELKTEARQDTVFSEMADRVRRHAGMSARDLYTKPLIVILSKADVLGKLVDFSREPLLFNPHSSTYALDLSLLMRVSFDMRQLLLAHVPEMVSATESFAVSPLYLPHSALGHSPSLLQGAGSLTLVVRPCDIESRWADVPMLFLLAQAGYVPVVRREIPTTVTARVVRDDSRYLYVSVVPGEVPLQVPRMYASFAVRWPTTGSMVRIPGNGE